MNLRKETRTPTRRAALVTAMLLAGCGAEAAAVGSREALAAVLPAHAGGGAGVAALMQTLRGASAVQHRGASGAGATTRIVSSCADDGGSGTLRLTLDAAGDGDVVDLSALPCSTITLTQGAIAVKPDSVTMLGPGAHGLAIDGAGTDRVFVHYGYGTLTLRALTVRNGASHLSGYKVAGGACIIGNGYVTLDHSVVTGCSAIGEAAYGGAILSHGVTLYTSTLRDNVAQGSLLKTLTASYGGGAFAYRGTAALYDSVVSANRAAPDPAAAYGSYDTGGGIFADNGGYALRSTIAGNYTDGTGGGIASHAPFFITNSTISGNTAKNKGGGGIFLNTSETEVIRNSTVALNSAARGGGIYVSGTPANLQLQSTIVAANSAPADAQIGAKSPLTITGDHNLVTQASGATVTLPPDTLSADPLLLPLADNGGPAPTHALAPASPAIDHGNNAAQLATDQRGAGHPRVLGAAPDIGAFEAAPRGAATVAPTPAVSRFGVALLAFALALLGVGKRRKGSDSVNDRRRDREIRGFHRR